MMDASSARLYGLGAGITALLLLYHSAPSAGARPLAVALTADTEGYVSACGTCGLTAGGLARRATVLSAIRKDDPAAVLVDAGNSFIGAESIDTGGRIILSAYAALGYDAVNLSYRDFRLGMAATVALVKQATFPIVSATLVDAASGRLLATPYVVRQSGDRRLAFVGATELPAGVEGLSHVKTQLAGVRMQPVADALSEWLPKAAAESDHVVLLVLRLRGRLECRAPAVRSSLGGHPRWRASAG